MENEIISESYKYIDLVLSDGSLIIFFSLELTLSRALLGLRPTSIHLIVYVVLKCLLFGSFFHVPVPTSSDM